MNERLKSFPLLKCYSTSSFAVLFGRVYSHSIDYLQLYFVYFFFFKYLISESIQKPIGIYCTLLLLHLHFNTNFYIYSHKISILWQYQSRRHQFTTALPQWIVSDGLQLNWFPQNIIVHYKLLQSSVRMLHY